MRIAISGHDSFECILSIKLNNLPASSVHIKTSQTHTHTHTHTHMHAHTHTHTHSLSLSLSLPLSLHQLGRHAHPPTHRRPVVKASHAQRYLRAGRPPPTGFSQEASAGPAESSEGHHPLCSGFLVLGAAVHLPLCTPHIPTSSSIRRDLRVRQSLHSSSQPQQVRHIR
jgi:hypothetical protein